MWLWRRTIFENPDPDTGLDSEEETNPVLSVRRIFEQKGIPADKTNGKSKGDLPLCFALADQHFSLNLPAKDGKECIRIMRVENGNLRELVGGA